MNNKVKEGRYWTNEDGTTGYQPFTVDNFEDCQHCGRPHGDEVEIVQGKDRAIVYLHPECEAPYRQRWGDKIIISTEEVTDDLGIFALSVDRYIQAAIIKDVISRIIEPGADLDAARKTLCPELVDAILAARERWKRETSEARMEQTRESGEDDIPF
jgi:hypothetical protein